MSEPAAMPEGDRPRRKLVVFLTFLVLFSCAYMPALQGYYAHHDDYYYWRWNNRWDFKDYLPAGHPADGGLRDPRTGPGAPRGTALQVGLA